jgi:hypothetical protein
MGASRYVATQDVTYGDGLSIERGTLVVASHKAVQAQPDAFAPADFPEQLRQAGVLFDPGEHSVDEVRQHLADHPEDEGRVLRMERNDKARKSLVGGAQSLRELAGDLDLPLPDGGEPIGGQADEPVEDGPQ